MWCGLAMAPQLGHTCEPTGFRKSWARRMFRREREVFFLGVGIESPDLCVNFRNGTFIH